MVEEGRNALLLATRGCGSLAPCPWSYDVFLMFAISRPDLLPVGDLGPRAEVNRSYGLQELPTVRELEAINEKWKPYRTVGTWYIWQGLKLPVTPEGSHYRCGLTSFAADATGNFQPSIGVPFRFM